MKLSCELPWRGKGIVAKNIRDLVDLVFCLLGDSATLHLCLQVHHRLHGTFLGAYLVVNSSRTPDLDHRFQLLQHWATLSPTSSIKSEGSASTPTGFMNQFVDTVSTTQPFLPILGQQPPTPDPFCEISDAQPCTPVSGRVKRFDISSMALDASTSAANIPVEAMDVEYNGELLGKSIPLGSPGKRHRAAGWSPHSLGQAFGTNLNSAVASAVPVVANNAAHAAAVVEHFGASSPKPAAAANNASYAAAVVGNFGASSSMPAAAGNNAFSAAADVRFLLSVIAVVCCCHPCRRSTRTSHNTR